MARALLAGALLALTLRLAPSFLVAPAARTRAPVPGAIAPPKVSPQQDSRGLGTAALGLAAVLAYKAARPSRRSFVVSVKPEAPVPALTGGSLGEQVSRGQLTARRSLYSCYTLYFRRWRYYEDRHRRNIRNRAYNIFMKNRYKKAMKQVLNYCVRLEFYDTPAPGSVEAVMRQVKPKLDEACEWIDIVTVQGVIHRNRAAKKKDRMFRSLLRGCVAKGYIDKPEDKWVPAYKLLGYKIPGCTHLREPRPWQLPGWKSPWMLKREYEKWRKLTGRAGQA
ncbi:unnamed protein product [Effrenium voratum]|nr:unnamed protein product [Effrenium voratum]|mmetsp:Transcript_87439/g.209182  ORF Transcript_87439/g.209182 Transcript_87439/m.209182 type:complete len:279 (+) Transcript_87439:45-881(+)